jgi:hypothetical protein
VAHSAKNRRLKGGLLSGGGQRSILHGDWGYGPQGKSQVMNSSALGRFLNLFGRINGTLEFDDTGWIAAGGEELFAPGQPPGA